MGQRPRSHPNHLLPTIGPTFSDAFVTLTYAAALTQRVKLGSTVIVVPYRNPLVVAKMLATLDVLSQGGSSSALAQGALPTSFRLWSAISPARHTHRRIPEADGGLVDPGPTNSKVASSPFAT